MIGHSLALIPTLKKSGSVKLVLLIKDSPFSEMMRPCKFFPQICVKCQPSHISGWTVLL